MMDFTKIKVWQRAHQVTLDVYRITSRELRRDRSLAAQMRRSAASVSMNIVEGCSASSQPELARYLQMSLSSAGELEYQLLLSHDLEYLTTHRYEALRSEIQEIKRMLTGFIRTVRNRDAKRRRDPRRDLRDEKGSSDT
jgi:four helix bundle protein